LTGQLGTTTTNLQKQVQQAQDQANFGNLFTILGLMNQQKQEEKPLPVVGEIKPFEFGSDLLAGVYQPSKPNMFNVNQQLLNLSKGYK
jgi:hypothetical protein